MRGAGFIDPIEESPSVHELPIFSQAFLIIVSRNPILLFVMLIAGVYFLVTGMAFRYFAQTKALLMQQDWRTPIASLTLLAFILATGYLLSFIVVRRCLPAFEQQAAIEKGSLADAVVQRYKTRYCAWRNCRQWLEFAIILFLLGGARPGFDHLTGGVWS